MSRGFSKSSIKLPAELAAKEKQTPVADKTSYLGETQNPDSILAFEEKHRTSKIETASGYTKDGKKLFDKSNNASNSVSFSPEQMHMFRRE